MRTILVGLLALLGPSAAWAQEAMVGDAAAGEQQFERQCVSCHVVENEAGEVLAGRNADTGPNLYGVAGRVPGSVPEFDYSELLAIYGQTGTVWEEENFVGFVQDPTGFLREATGESGRSKMPYQVRDEQEAYDLWAFLATFSPEEVEGGGGETGAEVPAGEDAAPADGETASE